jgi:hypothetical protein
MKQKSKKLTLIMSVGLVALLILGLALYQTKQSILPETTKILDWNGIPVSVTSTFGEYSNERNTPFCNSNDADVSLSNNASINNNDLILLSSLTTSRASCGQPNKIIATITLPKGKLTGNFQSSASSSETSGYEISESLGSINSFFKGRSSSHQDCSFSVNSEWRASNCAPSKNKDFIIDINDTTEVTIELSTFASVTGSASAKFTLNFVPSVVEQEQNNNTETLYNEETDSGTQDGSDTGNNQEDSGTPNAKIEKTNYVFYLIPLTFILLVALIVWARLKKPKRGKR